MKSTFPCFPLISLSHCSQSWLKRMSDQIRFCMQTEIASDFNIPKAQYKYPQKSCHIAHKIKSNKHWPTMFSSLPHCSDTLFVQSLGVSYISLLLYFQQIDKVEFTVTLLTEQSSKNIRHICNICVNLLLFIN